VAGPTLCGIAVFHNDNAPLAAAIAWLCLRILASFMLLLPLLPLFTRACLRNFFSPRAPYQ